MNLQASTRASTIVQYTAEGVRYAIVNYAGGYGTDSGTIIVYNMDELSGKYIFVGTGEEYLAIDPVSKNKFYIMRNSLWGIVLMVYITNKFMSTI